VSPAAITDPETGLRNEVFLRASFPTRVAMARRLLRPTSLVLLDVEDRDRLRQRCRSRTAQRVAETLITSLRESDTACRLDGGGFGLILEDTPEDGAVWTVERLRRSMTVDATIWAGVACYPAHGLEAATVAAGAEAALVDARLWATSRIEVASPER
jgi:diguanylate cyclase (GGDEF)-like protein